MSEGLAVVDKGTGEIVAENLAAIAALNAALAKAQADFPPIGREREVKAGSYSYKYAPLDVIFGAVRKPLTENGLALIQLLDGDGIRTELRHSEGGVIGASFPLPTIPAKPQELGSMLTYLRRYAVMAILGIATEEDDDGRAAQRSENGTKRSERTQAEPSVDERKVTQAQHARIAALIKELEEKSPPAEGQQSWQAEAREIAGVRSRADLTVEGADALIKWLEGQLEAAAIPF